MRVGSRNGSPRLLSIFLHRGLVVYYTSAVAGPLPRYANNVCND